MDPPRVDPPPPPLSLDLLSLTPVTLLPPLPKPSGDRVPSSPVPYPQLQDGFQLSPTSNYQAPYGQSSLGETLRARVRLHNVTTGPVYGVKMMMEVQSPGGRMRLGEVVHGGARPEGMDPSQAETRAWNELPILAPGEGVELAGEHELAELGMHILICSVAWETESGRRTFQRFLKFNAALPLAIKTRVITPSAPNTALDADRRGDVYLEVLMQNTAPMAMRLESAVLDAVSGLKARSITAPEADTGVDAKSSGGDDILPGDTIQRLFVLSPDTSSESENDDTPTAEKTQTASEEDSSSLPLSTFPPQYAAGTVLPLGRLRLSWLSGPHHEPGHFVTSMLNRRTTLPQPTPSRPTSLLSLSNNPRLSLNRSLNRPLPSREEWEWDLTVSGSRRVELESQLELTLRLGVRAPSDAMPSETEFGLQILTPTGQGQAQLQRRASRSSTPIGTVGTPVPDSHSRPMTPVSSQLRHAISSPAQPQPKPATPVQRPQSIQGAPGALPSATPTTNGGPSFPPPPTIARQSVGDGRVLALGPSLITLKIHDWKLVREQAGTSYAAEAPGTTQGGTKYEALWEGKVRWMAMEAGVADLGGVRVLTMAEGAVGKEWELGSAVVFE